MSHAVTFSPSSIARFRGMLLGSPDAFVLTTISSAVVEEITGRRNTYMRWEKSCHVIDLMLVVVTCRL